MWYSANMSKSKLVVVITAAVVIVGWFGWWAYKTEVLIQNVTDFLTCEQAGYPIMESYPRQCRTSDGRNFVEQIVAGPDKSDLIVVETPQPGAIVTSPFVVKGKARGNWFFEASFPIDLVLDNDNKIIATGITQAQSEWMTTDFVLFEATLSFKSLPVLCAAYPCTVPATLVLKKDNPSGLPQYDDSISIPITISEQVSTSTAKACSPTGCSGQICSDEDIVTTCEYRTEYACYKTARCERQANGACGWTQTSKLSQCLQSPPLPE